MGAEPDPPDVAPPLVDLAPPLPDEELEPLPVEFPEDPDVFDEPDAFDELLVGLLAARVAASSALPRSEGSRTIRSREHSIRDPSERCRLTRTVIFQSP